MNSRKKMATGQNATPTSWALTLISISIFFFVASPVTAQEKKEPLVIKGSIAAVGQILSNSDLATMDDGMGNVTDEPGVVPSEELQGDSFVYTAEVIFKRNWSNSFIFVHMRGSEGYPAYSFDNANSNDVPLRMSEATVELAAAIYGLTLFDSLTLFAGKIDPSVFFDGNTVANDSNRQFLAYPFVSNPALRFPFHEPGYMITLAPGDTFYAQVGIFEDRAAEVPGEIANKFIIGEAGVHYTPFEEDGNLRLMAWTSDYYAQGGFALSLDQTFGATFSAFSRVGFTRDAMDRDTESALSIGARINFGDQHHIGLGYSVQNPADTTWDAMTWVETYVSFNVDTDVFLTLDLQMVSNPDFDAELGTLWIPGFRIFAAFQ